MSGPASTGRFFFCAFFIPLVPAFLGTLFPNGNAAGSGSTLRVGDAAISAHAARRMFSSAATGRIAISANTSWFSRKRRSREARWRSSSRASTKSSTDSGTTARFSPSSVTSGLCRR